MIMSMAETKKEQGLVLFNQHDYEAARRAFEEAREEYTQAGLHDMAAEMKVNIGLVHRELGETQQALDLMTDALRTFEDQGDDLRMAQVHGNMGGVYRALGEQEKAESSYREAATLFEKLGENEMWSDTMLALGAMKLGSFKLVEGSIIYQLAIEERANLTFSQRVLNTVTGFILRMQGNPTRTTARTGKVEIEDDTTKADDTTNVDDAQTQ